MTTFELGQEVHCKDYTLSVTISKILSENYYEICRQNVYGGQTFDVVHGERLSVVSLSHAEDLQQENARLRERVKELEEENARLINRNLDLQDRLDEYIENDSTM